MAYKVIDLFAGVGGLSYGFAHDDEFKILAANEILEPMAQAYSSNHPAVKMYNKDIADFSAGDLAKDLCIKNGDIDVVVGFDGFCVLGFDPNQTYDTYEILFTKEHRRKDTKSNELAGDEIFALAGFVGHLLRATECTITKHDAYWDVDTALETITWKNES